MNKRLTIGDKELNYNLRYKNVKNINLRIKPDGSVWVSANKRISQKTIEEFLVSKADFILKALYKSENREIIPKTQCFSETEIRDVITKICKEVYPYFEKKGIKFPVIKFRKMVSQWGNCRSREGILTFNTNLMYAPFECVEYVVMHEFTHFVEANHSSRFYEELAKICPDWKERRKILKTINLR